MAALAGHSAKISNALTDIAGDELDGVKSIDWGDAADLIDTTDFADTSGSRVRGLLGLQDLTVTISGDYTGGTAQARFFTVKAAGTLVYVRFLPNGSTGFKAAMKVESIKLSSSIDGAVQVEFVLKLASGAVGTV